MRIITSLFNPKMIGKYIMDKMSVVLGYFFFFFILSMTPMVVRYLTTDYNMTYYSEVELFQEIENRDYSNYYIENNKLIGSGALVYKGDGISISFNTTDKTSGVSFAFYEEYVQLVSKGKVITTHNYETFDNVYFNMNSIKDRSFNDIYNLLSVMNDTYSSTAKSAMYKELAYQIGSYLFEMVIIMMLAVVLSQGWNPLVPRRLRFTIIVYAFTWTYVFTFLGTLFNLAYLQIIGFIISYIMANIALRNIVRIRKN